jgi:hypothetical protein
MKQLKKLLIGAFVFWCQSLTAQSGARFTISTTGTISLLATIDNINYNLPNMAQTWYNLQPGTIHVKVFQYKNQAGSEAGYKEIYTGNVNLTLGRHTELVVSRWGKVMFDENEILADNWSTGIPGVFGTATGVGTQGTKAAVSETEFSEIKKTMGQETYADGKLKLARILFKTNAFSTGQISELANQFIYDNDKLEFLKLAYPSCVDKNNYHILARLLKYSSDRDALFDFLSKQ